MFAVRQPSIAKPRPGIRLAPAPPIGMRGLAALCGGLAMAVALAQGAWAASQSLVILHDNDLHGHLRPFCYIEAGRGPQEHCQVGGAARRLTLIRALKARAKAPVLVIDAGDTSTRGPLITEYEGVDEVEAMNALGYDMAALGNNEFKLKDGADAADAPGAQAALERLVRRARFPWLAANVTGPDGALLAGVQPFVVRQIGGLRVAFLGLTTTKSRSYSQTKGLTYADAVEAANLWIPRARAEADVVIAVTHLGVDEDQRLVRETRGLDAVVGGHSHTFLYKPLEVKNLDGVVVPIVQDGEFGVNLGRFDLTFETDAAGAWRLTQWADRLVPVSAAIRPDPAVAALVETYAHPLDVKVGRVATVGATPQERTRLTALTLAEAWKASAGAEVGLQAEDSIYDSFHTLSVSRFDLRAVIPFHDTVWRGEMTGERLKALVEKSPGLGRVHLTIATADIDPARTYRVATITFLGKGLMPQGENTGVDDRAAAEDWLGKGAH